MLKQNHSQTSSGVEDDSATLFKFYKGHSRSYMSKPNVFNDGVWEVVDFAV